LIERRRHAYNWWGCFQICTKNAALRYSEPFNLNWSLSLVSFFLPFLGVFFLRSLAGFQHSVSCLFNLLSIVWSY
jgi:uncharacterized membrane protein YqaE (UPF0057 family)